MHALRLLYSCYQFVTLCFVKKNKVDDESKELELSLHAGQDGGMGAISAEVL